MPRTLTTEQKTALAATLADAGVAQILVDPSVADAVDYANAWSDVFTEKGWGVLIDSPEGLWPNTPSGLSLMCPGDLPEPAQVVALADALTALEIPFNRLDAMVPEEIALKIMIGRVGV